MKFELKNARCASTICTLIMIIFFVLAGYGVVSPSIAGAIILVLASIIVLHQLVIKPLRAKRLSRARKISHS